MVSYQKIEHPEISDITVLPSKDEAVEYSASLIADLVKNKPDSRITFATGNTQIPVYKKLAEINSANNIFSHISAFHLDEYYPCKLTDGFGFVNYLYKNVFGPLKIPAEKIFTINGMAENPEKEAGRYELLLRDRPIDLTILGIGPGGHIAFCEAGTPFSSTTQLINLSKETIYRDQVERGQKSPGQAITQGIATILSSQKIILNAFGTWYGKVMKEVLYSPISENIPGSALRTCGKKVSIILDQEASNELN